MSGAVTVQQGLAGATQRLTEAGVPGAARDARLLIADALGIAADRVTLALRDEMTDAQRQTYEAHVARRAAREPVSHILGKRAFFGSEFKVTDAVLDPRPETEILVIEALKEPFAQVLDLGTGSGAILLSLLRENPLAKGLGVDLSPDALEIATENAAQLGLSKRARFQQARWCGGLSGSFDLIVSNPPYIAQSDMQGLSPELSYEPRMALTDEADGLSAYREITRQAPAFLRPGGRLIVEIGPAQGAEVAQFFLDAGLKGVRVLPDLDGRDRIVLGRVPMGRSQAVRS